MGNSSSSPAESARPGGALAGDLVGSPSSSSHALSFGRHPSILDLAAAATAAARVGSSHSPRSLPLSGAPPVPAPGGATGGSTVSSGGAGPDLGGALALILVLLLGAKFLRYARDSLKPDSIYGLIVNQPG